jgi:hypothetical protein
MNNGIHKIEYVKQSAISAGKLSRIDIYRGFIDPGNKTQIALKVKEIRPISERDFGNKFELFEQNEYGDFTAVFFPSREIIYFTNKGSEIMNGTQQPSFQGIPSEEVVQAQVQKILENERLKQRLADLEEEAAENSEWGKRMGIAVEMLIGNFLGLPKNNQEPQPALNGTDGEEYDTTHMSDTEKALVLIVKNFGEDWIKKFAAKIQADPSLVSQIKNFF